MWNIFGPILRTVNLFQHIFGASTATLTAPNSVSVVPAPIDRLARVREAKVSLDAMDKEMLRFKQRYRVRTNKFGILLSVESPTMGGYSAIEKQWRELLTRRDRVVSAWHQALHEWADAKGVK